MQDAKLNLRSWASNSQSLTAEASKDKVVADSTNVSILGLWLNTLTDTLSLTPQAPTPRHYTLVTKQEILWESLAIFDPLRLVSPVTIKAKIFIQHLWQQRLLWNEPLHQDDQDEWLTIINEIGESTSMSIARCYFIDEDNQSHYQLHVFSDASTKANGAVAFICNELRTCFGMA